MADLNVIQKPLRETAKYRIPVLAIEQGILNEVKSWYESQGLRTLVAEIFVTQSTGNALRVAVMCRQENSSREVAAQSCDLLDSLQRRVAPASAQLYCFEPSESEAAEVFLTQFDD